MFQIIRRRRGELPPRSCPQLWLLQHTDQQTDPVEDQVQGPAKYGKWLFFVLFLDFLDTSYVLDAMGYRYRRGDRTYFRTSLRAKSKILGGSWKFAYRWDQQ